MSQKAEKPPDPAHEAKLAARREKHAVKVWSANPRTQELQRKYDEALRQLQQLRDGAKPKSCYATPSGACKRKHDGRGGDRKSALYKLQKQMGPTAAPQLK